MRNGLRAWRAFDNKSAAETLYDQGTAGTDPYYKYATDKATQSINDAAAARAIGTLRLLSMISATRLPISAVNRRPA